MENYYSVLNINRSATQSDVRRAYLTLAREYHPDSSKNPATAETFKAIAKAYDVLSNPIKRCDYDYSLDVNQFLKNPFGEGSIPSTGETIDEFFENPFNFKEMSFSDSMDWVNEDSTSVSGFSFPHMNMHGFNKEPCFKRTTLKDATIERDIFVSLEELNTGTEKRLKITRQIELSSGMSRADEKVLIIPVKPGMKSGTRITFANEGDQKPGILPADVIITIRDKEHKEFTRDADNNLIYTRKLFLKEALLTDFTDIPTLDGRTLRINHDIVIHPGTQTIEGEGLPLPNNPHRRANLIVKYDIIFPQHLSSQQKQVICDSLPKY